MTLRTRAAADVGRVGDGGAGRGGTALAAGGSEQECGKGHEAMEPMMRAEIHRRILIAAAVPSLLGAFFLLPAACRLSLAACRLPPYSYLSDSTGSTAAAFRAGR